MVRFSVVIVNFNGVAWLRTCLDSVMAQDLRDGNTLEVIVVDNGSSDGSVEFLRREQPGVCIVESPTNGGFATGCALGISHSTGDEILLLNNDTRIERDAVQGLYDERCARGLDVIAAVEVPYDGGVFQTKRAMIDPLGFPIIRGSDERLGVGTSFFLSAACVLVSKSNYDSSGGLDTSFFMYYEDVDWFWRMRLYGYRFDYSQRIAVYHFALGSAHGVKFDYKRFLWRNSNQPRILIKNYQLATLVVVLPLYVGVSTVEALALLAMGRGDLAKSYLRASVALATDMRTLLKDRKVVQRRRQMSDLRVLSHMYPGLASASGLWSKVVSMKNRDG